MRTSHQHASNSTHALPIACNLSEAEQAARETEIVESLFKYRLTVSELNSMRAP